MVMSNGQKTWTFVPHLKKLPQSVPDISCSQEWNVRVDGQPKKPKAEKKEKIKFEYCLKVKEGALNLIMLLKKHSNT